MIRVIAGLTYGLLILAAVFSSMDGILWLGTAGSRVVVLFLWATCCLSSILIAAFDRGARVLAVLILLMLSSLLLPTLW